MGTGTEPFSSTSYSPKERPFSVIVPYGYEKLKQGSELNGLFGEPTLNLVLHFCKVHEIEPSTMSPFLLFTFRLKGYSQKYFPSNLVPSFTKGKAIASDSEDSKALLK